MIPTYWYSDCVVFLWQVVLHSVLAGSLLYAWSRLLELRSGATKRRLLCLLLVLPLATAAVPGRNSFDFRQQMAWLDSTRLLAVPLVGGLQLYHLILLVAALSTVACLWQEVLPVFRRPRSPGVTPPKWLLERVRSCAGWSRCELRAVPTDHIFLATGGWPLRPVLIISEGTIQQFAESELNAALRHENAHWQKGRWHLTHLLFCLRLAQCYNPIALWAFRELAVEIELACDADAVAGGDRKPLARALMKVYEATAPQDRAARSTLRKRVDALLGEPSVTPPEPATETVVLSVFLLALLLPWVV